MMYILFCLLLLTFLISFPPQTPEFVSRSVSMDQICKGFPRFRSSAADTDSESIGTYVGVVKDRRDGIYTEFTVL
ncbi:hypothetical protein AKJ16_DCAP18569 [Drosera capensis]